LSRTAASPGVGWRRQKSRRADAGSDGVTPPVWRTAMSISDILVYVDPSPASGERLDLAFHLAHRFGAYLIGVVPEDAAAVGDRFGRMLRQQALQGDWQMAIGLAAAGVTRRAHAAEPG